LGTAVFSDENEKLLRLSDILKMPDRVQRLLQIPAVSGTTALGLAARHIVGYLDIAAPEYLNKNMEENYDDAKQNLAAKVAAAAFVLHR